MLPLEETVQSAQGLFVLFIETESESTSALIKISVKKTESWGHLGSSLS